MSCSIELSITQSFITSRTGLLFPGSSDRKICFHPTDEQQYTTLDVSFTTKSVLYMKYYFTNYTYARPFIIHVTLQDTGITNTSQR